MRKRAHILTLLSLTLELSSCQSWFSKKRVDPPPAVLAPTPKPLPPEPVLSPPPKIGETTNPAPPNIPPERIVTPPGPKKARPARTRPVAPKPAVEAPPAAQVEQAPPVPAPKLGQIFTTEQRNEYNRSLDESLDRVRKLLVQVQGRTLREPQMELVQRIRAFEKQAMQARDQDLVSAVSLANRADVLARDLMAQLQ